MFGEVYKYVKIFYGLIFVKTILGCCEKSLREVLKNIFKVGGSDLFSQILSLLHETVKISGNV